MKAKALLTCMTILVLALSADVWRVQQEQAFPSQRPLAAASVLGAESSSIDGQVITLSTAPYGQSADEDGPAPALIIYLMLTLIGSGIAIGLVRQSKLR